jgi:hypothetical protein
MRNCITALTCVLLCLIIICCNSAGNNHEYVTDSADLPGHPRLLLLQGEEQQIKEKISADSLYQVIHQLIMHECERILNKPLIAYELKGRRLLSQSRECRKRIFYLSYAWRMTRENKYLVRAEQELLEVSGFKDWNPSHFLDVAEMTMAVAIGYDWLFEVLPEATLNTLREAIIQKGLNPSLENENSWWLSEANNWNQVCNASLAVGALAVYEHDPEFARKIINRSIHSIRLPMKNYEPDGAFPEGYMYWGYGTTFTVYLIDALEKVYKSDFGLASNSGFLNTGRYVLNMMGPSGKIFNYSDSDDKPAVNPAMVWMANQSQDLSLLYQERQIIRDNLYGIRDLPALMIWGKDTPSWQQIPVPDYLFWHGRGENPVALMRTSWDEDALFAGIKGGSARNGHAHMDAGSFVVDAMGLRWAMDLGGQNYDLAESAGMNIWSRKQNSQRWQLFRHNNLAHNTLTFNMQYQRVEGLADFKHYSDDEQFLSAVVDLTSVYPDFVVSALRGIAIVNKKFVVIQDEVQATSKPSEIRWTMVTPATVKIIDSQTAELHQQGKKMMLKVISPASVKLTTWSNESTAVYDEPNPGTIRIGFEYPISPGASQTFTILLMPEHNQESVKSLPELAAWKSNN